jgi:arylformamidase
VPDSTTVDEIELKRLVGPATVYNLGDVNSITAADLATLKIPYPTERILFKTKSSSFWEDGTAFRDDYTHISPDGAQWLVDNGVRLVGFDYLSAERYDADEPLAHLILLKAEIIIVEGLNLKDIEPGAYTLICLPIKIKGGDGAPARAVLVQE